MNKPIKTLWFEFRHSLRTAGMLITLKKIYMVLSRRTYAARYRAWIREKQKRGTDLSRIQNEISGFSYRPVFSIITPVHNIEGKFLKKCIDSVFNQFYPHWELCICDDHSTKQETLDVLKEFEGFDPRIKIVYSRVNLNISGASNRAVEQASGEYIGFLDHDDEIAPEALYEIAKALNAFRNIDVIYTDEDKIERNGSFSDPMFKPDWSPELLLSFMYVLHFLVVRRSLFVKTGMLRGEYDGAQDYDLMLRLSAMTKHIHHISTVLYHWRKIRGSAAAHDVAKPYALLAGQRALEDHLIRNHPDAEVFPLKTPGLYRVKHRIKGSPLVSLLITTDDRELVVQKRGKINLLENVIKSISSNTDYKNYEIVVIDNGNLSEKTKKELKNINYRLVSYENKQERFNFSHKANFAFKQAEGEHIVLLNDDMEIISSEWLSALLEFSQQKEIGVVGGRLLYPDNRIQHAGVILGIRETAGHVYFRYPAGISGYLNFPNIIRNYLAVTGACMMTRREVFNEVGGFDERFFVDFNDIDFCLSVFSRGYRVVYTPYCDLYHFDQSTLSNRIQDPEQLRLFTQKWGKYIKNDPYYNPNLSKSRIDFSMEIPDE
jgi:GT2 family glycosyltransferase